MSRRCTRCQTVYAGDTRFCPRDGSPLVEVAGAAATPSGSGGSESSRTMVRAAVKRQLGPSVDQAGALQGEIIDGRYKVLKQLGEGGMS